jgi:hypothetical protein
MPLSPRKKEALVALATIGGAAGAFALILEQRKGGGPDALSAPTGLRISNRSADGCFLTWDAVAGASGYVIASGGSDVAKTVGTCAEMGGIPPGTTPSFTVAAMVGGQRTPASGAVAVPA